MPGIFEGGLGLCGFFMDPPYGVTDRDGGCYSTESFTVAHDVRAWCIEHGQNPHLRIVLAGYEEHDELAQHGWRKETWKTAGYLGGKKSMANRTRETIWFSPFCLDNQPCLL
jgi:hypothetical protein